MTAPGTFAAYRLLAMLDLARQGRTLEQIGAIYGITRERVRQVLAEAGYRSRELRDVRCTYCGDQLRSARATAGVHFCRKRECQSAYSRDYQEARRGPREHGICDNCGVTLRYPPRPDGTPQWCARGKLACLAARKRYAYANSAPLRAWIAAYVKGDHYRAYQREYARREHIRARRAAVDQRRKAARRAAAASATQDKESV